MFIFCRIFDLCTHNATDWKEICKRAKHHLSSDCAVCLTPLQSTHNHTHTLSQLHTSALSQPHTSTHSQLHTSTLSQPHTSTLSQPHTSKSSQPHTTTLSQPHTSTSSQSHTCSNDRESTTPQEPVNPAHRPLSVLSCCHVLHTSCIEAMERYSMDHSLLLCPLCRASYQRTLLVL